MGSRVAQLAKEELISPPRWLASNIQYEVIHGSQAYGTNVDNSDLDIYGWCIPPRAFVFPYGSISHIYGFGTPPATFEQFQQQHVETDETNYDMSIYSIVKFISLCMDNNPNMLDALFVPRDCILHITPIGEMVRDKRREFLHKGSYHKFKNYALSQIQKMQSKNVTGKRKAIVEKYGFDCYVEAETEFLTEHGWKKFDEVKDAKLGVLDKHNVITFEKPINTIDKTTKIEAYVVEPFQSRCVVTPDHKMLVSLAHRAKRGYAYDENDSDWKLTPFRDLLASRRSCYHVRRAADNRVVEYDIPDVFLEVSGLYVSEGTVQFRNNKLRHAVLSQTTKGKQKFFQIADTINREGNISYKRYTYTRKDTKVETRWVIDKETSQRLYDNYGCGSHKLRLPSWTLRLSYRQAKLFWDCLMLGDGTYTRTGDVYYTCNKMLADDIQAMMVSSGHMCTIRGPFKYKSNFGCDNISYQIYLTHKQSDKFKLVSFSEERLDNTITKESRSVKRLDNAERRVVCFEVPSGILITRSNGKPAIHGNCKFGAHAMRLLYEAEQILTKHDIYLRDRKDELIALRTGQFTLEQVVDMAEKKGNELEKLFVESKLKEKADEEQIKKLLLDCLEHHYGSLNKFVDVIGEEKEALKSIAAVIDKIRDKL